MVCNVTINNPLSLLQPMVRFKFVMAHYQLEGLFTWLSQTTYLRNVVEHVCISGTVDASMKWLIQYV